MKNKIAKLISALVVAAMFVAAIPMVTAAEEPQDTLILGMQSDAKNLNWFDPDTNDVWKSNILGFNFETLMAYTPDFELYPVLAKPGATDEGADYTADTSGLNITFNLRPGITFTDGTAMTSADVVFSYQALGWGLFQTQIITPLLWTDKEFKSFKGGTVKTHIGVEAVDADSVVFHLNGPYSMFWYATLNVPIIPLHVWTTHLVALDAASLDDFDIPGSTEWQLDYSYGADGSEKDATIGTGPWMLNYWTEGVGAQIDIYEDYWGSNETIAWGGVDYPQFPEYVRHVQFKQYGALDVAILALKKGEIHFIPWNIGSGFYNSLKTDPNIGFQIPQDQGFFYTSFNFRKAPMNDLNFRKVVAYCTDKDYIVNRLMGGYGTKGTVPIAITNPFYINNTAPDWVANFNMQEAEDILDEAGYDVGSDGWRTNPDGTPLKISILTPPKDYDPVRADAGIMISKNLKSLKINAESAPTSFDTIVSKAYVSFDFDIYCLGWSVGSFPENYLLDFFHSDYDVAVNPAGSNAAGYHNPTADALMDEMLVTMDNTIRAKMIKDICGIVMEELPYNVLYYRKNIEAFRQSTWQGWIPAFGTVYNGFSLNSLHPPTTGGGSVTPPAPVAGELYVRVGMPANVPSESDVTGQVYVSQDSMPVSGATLEITPSYSATLITATTDANGYAEFTDTVPFQSGTASFSIYVEKGDKNATAYGATNVIIAPVVRQLSLNCTTPVIEAGDTAWITAKVTNEKKAPVKGVVVEVDKTLLLGTVTTTTNVTGNTGLVNFTYTAPGVSDLPNTNTMDIFKATIAVSDVLVPEVQSASIVLGIENPTPSEWWTIDFTNATSYVIDLDNASAAPKNTTINATVYNYNGTVAGGKKIDIEVSNTSVAVASVTQATSNATTGVISFNVSCVLDVVDTIDVKLTVNGTSYGGMETMSLLVNETNTGYAAVAHYTIRGVDHTATTDITLTLYNSSNMPAIGVPVMLNIPSTDQGFPGQFPDGLDMSWCGAGMVYPYFDDFDDFDTEVWEAESADDGNLWDFASNVETDANGTVTTTIAPFSMRIDQRVTVEMMWGADLLYQAESWWWSSEFVDYDHMITSSFVQGRAPLIAMGSVVFDKAYATKEANYAKVTATFYDLNGKIDNSKVRFYEGTGSSKKALTYENTVNGVFTYVATPAKVDSTLGVSFTMLSFNDEYAYGETMPYMGDQVASMPFEFAFPYIYTPNALMVTGESNNALVSQGDTASFDVMVTDIYGDPVEDAMVYGGSAVAVTDVNGTAVLEVVAGEAGINAFTFTATKGYDTGSVMLSTFGGIPNFVYSAPTIPANVTKGAAATIGVTVTNSGPVSGDAVVDLSVDGAVVQSKVVSVAAGGVQAVSFTYVYTGTANTTSIAVASLAAQTVTVNQPTAVVTEEVTEGYGIEIVAGAAIAMLVVGLLIGWLVLAKMMGGSKPDAPKPAPKAAPKPAPKPAPQQAPKPEEPKAEEPKQE